MGPAGTSGAQGPQAAIGLQGPTGATGLQGETGAPGTNGTKPDPPCFDNTNRYVNCGNGTVTDTVTALIWLQDADCLGLNSWAAANQTAAGLKDGDCGGNLTDKSSPGDWRLPTKDEWDAMMISGCSPALSSDAGTSCMADGASLFTGVAKDDYWSRTAFRGSIGRLGRAPRVGRGRQPS